MPSRPMPTLPRCRRDGDTLLKVPEVICARRSQVHEGTREYTTVYEFASIAVPESAAWKKQQQHPSPKSPRMQQAITYALGSAGVYTRIDP
jgi:hypothetical protein